MTCDEALEIAPLWLSGELDGIPRAQIVAHLDSCADCSRILSECAEADAKLRAALAAESDSRDRVAAFVSGRIRTEDRSRRTLTAIGVAAALLLAFGLGSLFLRNQLTPKLLSDAARDHRQEVMEHQPRRWRSEFADVDAVAQRFGITGLTTRAMAPTGYRLVHAKTCGLAGQPALHLVYSDGTREISLYIRRHTGNWSHSGSAVLGTERVADAESARYSAVVVSTGDLNECRNFAQRAVNLL